jgi:hypothetical protein
VAKGRLVPRCPTGPRRPRLRLLPPDRGGPCSVPPPARAQARTADVQAGHAAPGDGIGAGLAHVGEGARPLRPRDPREPRRHRARRGGCARRRPRHAAPDAELDRCPVRPQRRGRGRSHGGVHRELGQPVEQAAAPVRPRPPDGLERPPEAGGGDDPRGSRRSGGQHRSAMLRPLVRLAAAPAGASTRRSRTSSTSAGRCSPRR